MFHDLENCSFAPDPLICQALEEAWRQIAPTIGSDPVEMKSARVKLAHAVLLLAGTHSRDVEQLKTLVLNAMKLG